MVSHGILDNIKFTKRLSYLVGGISVFILIFSFIYYGINHWFFIDRVVVTGKMEHVDTKKLSEFIESRVYGNLFAININALQDDFGKFPWLKDVIVSRDFPNSILVEISEYTAVARLANIGLVADDGAVFAGVDNTQRLPLIHAREVDVGDALFEYKLVNDIFSKHQVRVEQIFMTSPGVTKIDFSNKLRVVFCGIAIESQVHLLSDYWDKLYSLNPKLNYVNMCYKNALAINKK